MKGYLEVQNGVRTVAAKTIKNITSSGHQIFKKKEEDALKANREKIPYFYLQFTRSLIFLKYQNKKLLVSLSLTSGKAQGKIPRYTNNSK